jgi:cell division septal protein FtsQ
MDERIRERRRAVLAQRARRRRRATYSVLVLLVVAGAVAALLRTSLFDISDVRVEGVQGEQAEQAGSASQVRPGENLLMVDLGDAEARIEGLAWVADARARREPPSGVVFVVTPREPVAVLSVGEAAWLLDAGGFVVAGGTQPGLVPIVAPNAVPRAVGDRIAHRGVLGALAVHAALPGGLRSQVDAYDAADEHDLRLHLRDPAAAAGEPGVWLRIGPAERIAEKAAVTSALLERVRAPDGPAVAEIDVRAPGNPVLIPLP